MFQSGVLDHKNMPGCELDASCALHLTDPDFACALQQLAIHSRHVHHVRITGDQTIFVRARDFHEAGGFDERLAIMEDADLVMRLHSRGTSPGARVRAAMSSSRQCVAPPWFPGLEQDVHLRACSCVAPVS